MNSEERIAVLESQLSLMKARFEMLLTFVKQHTHKTKLSETTVYGGTTWEGEPTGQPEDFWIDGTQLPEDI